MMDMSDNDKASNIAIINKTNNALQNIVNTSTGIYSYGGDSGMQNGYYKGTLKLTQSYKNFDKIIIVASNDGGDYLTYHMWDIWLLARAFANSYSFCLFGREVIYWIVYGNNRHGTNTDYVLSTDTIWSCQEQNCGLVDIIGVNY